MIKNMPDESCRLCGGELVKCTICAECRKPVGMICAKCRSRTTEQVHDCCFILKFDETQQNSDSNNGIFLKHVLVA